MKLTPEEKMEMPAWLTEIQSETIPESVPAEEPITDERKTATLPEEERDEVEQMPEWLHLLEQEGPEGTLEPVAEVKPVEEPEPVVPAPFDFASFAETAEPKKSSPEELPDFLASVGFMDTVLPAAKPAEIPPAPKESAPIFVVEPEQIPAEEFVAPIIEEFAPVIN